MTRTRTTWTIFAATTALLALGLTPRTGWSDGDDEEEIAFDVAEIFFELNDTDGDLGVHALIDGEPWKRLEIEDPREREILDIRVKSRLRRQGLTELFFESAEPNFDDLPPRVFFRRFPAGVYEIEGSTLDGRELESETRLTHVIPAAPDGVTVNDMAAGPPGDAEDCDEGDLPDVGNPVVVAWDAVTTAHEELGEWDPDIDVIRYQVVAEWEDEEENVFVASIDILPDGPTDRYQVSFPPEFFVDGSEVKFEVLVREASFNQTAFESCPFEFVGD